jgi:hypothetical protein
MSDEKTVEKAVQAATESKNMKKPVSSKELQPLNAVAVAP